MPSDTAPLVSTIISCEQRKAARDETLPQLWATGFEPEVFLSPCKPAGPRSNIEVGLRALQHAAERGASLLFCEDDIDLHVDFRGFLRMARAAGEVTYFYINDRPDRGQQLYGPEVWQSILDGEPQKRRLHLSRRYFGLFGTQCVYMPHDAVLEAIEVAKEKDTATDTALAKAWARNMRPVYIALPHPVQHRNDRTARGKEHQIHPKVSRSFDLPRI